MKDSSDITGTTHPLAQLRVARRKPVAALLGATAGLVPVGVFELGHYELTSWSPLGCPKAAIVYAGLLFSALTVLGWSSDMFGSRVKAIGFTALLEGIMMIADAGWLSRIALCYLVAINQDRVWFYYSRPKAEEQRRATVSARYGRRRLRDRRSRHSHDVIAMQLLCMCGCREA